MRKKFARWSNEPNECGLRSIGQPPRGYRLRLDGEEIISVAAAGGGALNGPLRGWYWVGLGRNTYREGKIWPTKEEAKADADAAYKEWKRCDSLPTS